MDKGIDERDILLETVSMPSKEPGVGKRKLHKEKKRKQREFLLSFYLFLFLSFLPSAASLWRQVNVGIDLVFLLLLSLTSLPSREFINSQLTRSLLLLLFSLFVCFSGALCKRIRSIDERERGEKRREKRGEEKDRKRRAKGRKRGEDTLDASLLLLVARRVLRFLVVAAEDSVSVCSSCFPLFVTSALSG